MSGRRLPLDEASAGHRFSTWLGVSRAAAAESATPPLP